MIRISNTTRRQYFISIIIYDPSTPCYDMCLDAKIDLRYSFMTYWKGDGYFKV